MGLAWGWLGVLGTGAGVGSTTGWEEGTVTVFTSSGTSSSPVMSPVLSSSGATGSFVGASGRHCGSTMRIQVQAVFLSSSDYIHALAVVTSNKNLCHVPGTHVHVLIRI
jgi:hypothetical protein